MAADAVKAGQKVWITANNKAEGSAPLTLLKLAEEIDRIYARTHNLFENPIRRLNIRIFP